jgi:hypothetical protein
MNDRQRLEAIIGVVCKYLPPDGIPANEAMSQIIALVDPLPEPVPEPDAVVTGYYGGNCVVTPTDPARVFNTGTVFYTTPPAQPADHSKLLHALEELLQQLDEPCRIDYQGFCQSHYFYNVNDLPGGCQVANARALVAKAKGGA